MIDILSYMVIFKVIWGLGIWNVIIGLFWCIFFIFRIIEIFKFILVVFRKRSIVILEVMIDFYCKYVV